MNQVKPNFFVVGAAKAGTTSIYSWLKQHPDIFVPEVKEPSYFVHGYGFSDFNKYLELFERGQGKKSVGDTSASYLAAPESPAWIYNTFGQQKIVIILRNPARRAYSLYSWMVMEGYEWASSFERGLKEEDARFQSEAFYWKNPEYFWDYIYFRSGFYFEQVKRYIDVFGRNNVNIYLFDDLIKSPEKIYSDLCNFLEVSNQFLPDYTHENPSRIPRFVPLQFSLRTKSSRLVNKLPLGLQSWLFEFNKRIGLKPKIKPSTEERLRKLYGQGVQKLSEFIQKDLSNWM
jgi:hypothetical protein